MFTVIDIETTGLSKNYHHITEIAAARVVRGRVVKTFQTLINPQTQIPTFITQLTGINNEMVKNSPTIDQVLPSFIQFLGNDIFVAHNATFDYGFLSSNLKRHLEFELENHRLCTRKLANRMFPELPRKRLQDLCTLMNVQNVQAHRAMADVQATVQVFNNILQILHNHGIKEHKEIIEFEQSPAQSIRIKPYLQE